MKITNYNASHQRELETLYVDTFSASDGQEEGRRIGSLVNRMLTETGNVDLFSFVACNEQKIIAGIIFTRLTFQSEINAFILSPVAVHPDYQSQGVGQALINHGLEYLRLQGVELVFTYGDPSYYSKVGFQQISEELINAPQKMSMPRGWLCQSLEGKEIEAIAGPSCCVPALNQPEYW